MEADKVPEAGYEILLLKVKGLSRGKNVLKHLSTGYHLMRAFFSIRHELKLFRPEVVVGVGGYASAPTLLAAQSLGIPTLIQEQNGYAGITNKLVGRRAKVVCVAYEGMERFFPKAGKLVLTGNPVRAELLSEGQTAMAYEALGLSPNKRTLLVLGGSLGARTINNSVAKALDELVAREEWLQVLWQCGKGYAEEAYQLLKEKGYEGRNVVVRDFISQMNYAYSVADLVVSRAGAGSISEFTLLGKPVILVPSPNVAEDHQTKNAQALEQRGAALLIPDHKAEEELFGAALPLLEQPERLATLGANAKQMALPRAAEKIVDELEQML